jgi:hypothetical protein
MGTLLLLSDLLGLSRLVNRLGDPVIPNCFQSDRPAL